MLSNKLIHFKIKEDLQFKKFILIKSISLIIELIRFFILLL
jgi:hypothetical protein